MALTFPGLGAKDLVPAMNLDFDATAEALSPEDYFVLTRVDGKTNLAQLVLISGFPEARAIDILVRLRKVGALLLPGDVPPPKRPAPPPTATTPVPGEEETDNDLTVEQRRAILVKLASLAGANHFQVLGVPEDASRRVIKLEYFKLSKEFHPDRFYGKRLGKFAARLNEIFEAARDAFEILGDDARRTAYREALANPAPPEPPPPEPPPPPAPEPRARTVNAADQARAARLFEDACNHQVAGELDEAMAEMAACIAIDPQVRYLRRAAECALKAQELRSAEEYAKKVAELEPRNALAQRMLAKVLRAAGKLDEAERATKEADNLDGRSTAEPGR